ncbi:hypothetical protein FRB94_008300 [Tulasnella sp. JGI-2019a]|nr:hypothetical protein FRB94_008300 [Tulasnella sp. JGI-2019a]
MLFVKGYTYLAMALCAISSVLAGPLPLPLQKDHAAQLPSKRAFIIDENPTSSDGGAPVPYSNPNNPSKAKRGFFIDDAEATSSTGGDPVEYVNPQNPNPKVKRHVGMKRQLEDGEAMLSAGAAMKTFHDKRSDGGAMLPDEATMKTYLDKRSKIGKRRINTFPSHIASRSK